MHSFTKDKTKNKSDSTLTFNITIIKQEHEDGPEIGDIEKGKKLERESDVSEHRKSFEG